jgi:hypothetical protein
LAKERKATLGEIGTKIVRQKNAPQVTGQIVGGFVVGKEYADAAGNRAVWDGEKWNEVE